jgi:hypothetical protein
MGRIVKYTDLSWEIPGPRAYVDVPLEGPGLLPDLATWARAEWHDNHAREESPAGQRFTLLSAVPARISSLRGRRRIRRGQ